MTGRLLAALASASRQYGGEPVSELAHSLQCADLAEAAGADEELVLASLLHDVGRFAVDPGLIDDGTESATPASRGGRGHHDMGAALIAPHVSVRVAWLVRMHVPAKRYLCATEPDYLGRLTPVSRHTLALQGGIMTPGRSRPSLPTRGSPPRSASAGGTTRRRCPTRPRGRSTRGRRFCVVISPTLPARPRERARRHRRRLRRAPRRPRGGALAAAEEPVPCLLRLRPRSRERPPGAVLRDGDGRGARRSWCRRLRGPARARRTEGSWPPISTKSSPAPRSAPADTRTSPASSPCATCARRRSSGRSWAARG